MRIMECNPAYRGMITKGRGGEEREGKKYILFYVATIKKAIRVEMRFYRSLILSENLSLRGQIEETIIKTSYLEKNCWKKNA